MPSGQGATDSPCTYSIRLLANCVGSLRQGTITPTHNFLMRKILLVAFLVPVTAVVFSSCAAVAGKMATPERVAQLPEPIRSQVQELVRQQKAMEVRYTSGTRKMLEAYYIIADAIGLKKEAMVFKAEADALKAGSSLKQAQKAVEHTASAMKAVRAKIGSSDAKSEFSKEKFVSGVRAKNEAYMIEYQIGIDAGVQAAKGIAAMKSASPMDKVMLTATLDPLFFFARDIPKFQAQEREFDESCKKYAQVKGITLPPANLPTPKPVSLPAF
jgi:hypothetical protein